MIMMAVAIGVVICSICVVYAIIYLIDRLVEKYQKNNDCHTGKFLTPEELTAKLLEHGFVFRKKFDDGVTRVAILPCGMWEDDYEEMIKDIENEPTDDGKCVIAAAYCITNGV